MHWCFPTGDFEKLKDEFDALKRTCEELSAKYEGLEKKCKECSEEFNKKGDLKNHEKTHNLSKGTFECVYCGKMFNEEWKLNAHLKIHQDYSSYQCDKKFKKAEIKDKYVEVAHGKIKI